jgi:hypothetical protein
MAGKGFSVSFPASVIGKTGIGFTAGTAAGVGANISAYFFCWSWEI